MNTPDKRTKKRPGPAPKVTLGDLANTFNDPYRYGRLYRLLARQLGPERAAAMQAQAYMLIGEPFLPNTLLAAMCDRNWSRYLSAHAPQDVVAPEKKGLIETDESLAATLGPLAQAVIVALVEAGLPIRDDDAPLQSPAYINGGVKAFPHGHLVTAAPTTPEN